MLKQAWQERSKNEYKGEPEEPVQCSLEAQGLQSSSHEIKRGVRTQGERDPEG